MAEPMAVYGALSVFAGNDISVYPNDLRIRKQSAHTSTMRTAAIRGMQAGPVNTAMMRIVANRA